MSKFGVKGGGGVVLRDHNGTFLAGVCHLFHNHVDPEAVEILACRRALQVAVECSVERVHLELDNKAVVHMLNEPQKTWLLWDHGYRRSRSCSTLL